VAGALGIGNEADEQHAAIGSIGRLLAELVAPKPEGPPGAQFVRYQADDIGVFTWLGDEFEVVEPDFFEGQVSVGITGRPLFEERMFRAVD
jgi:hypothetical protein